MIAVRYLYLELLEEEYYSGINLILALLEEEFFVFFLNKIYLIRSCINFTIVSSKLTSL